MNEVTDDELTRIAHILGPASAAAAALLDMSRRREIGESPVCFRTGSTLVVASRPATAPAPGITDQASNTDESKSEPQPQKSPLPQEEKRT